MENTIDVQLLDQELFAFWAPRCPILKQGQLEISYTTQLWGQQIRMLSGSIPQVWPQPAVMEVNVPSGALV